jgi:hypothetical protein
LRGVAVVSPQITSKKLRAMAEQGVVGIRLNLVGLPIPDLLSEEWVKLSAAYRICGAEQTREACSRTARALLASFGPSRLMWASDWPNTQHQHLVDYDATRRALDCWIKDEKHRRIILADMPTLIIRRLFESRRRQVYSRSR